jgi:peptidyl-tRNA hydrolase
MDAAKRDATILDAMDSLRAIEPRDNFERMLGAQMVACHHAAMECFRLAMNPNQTFSGRDMSLKHAVKLMAAHARHLETLNKHRGKGQQRVIVEHVNVEAGGQAIVGNVESGAKTRNPSDPAAIEHAPEKPMEILKSKKKTLSKRGKTNGGNT